MIKEDWTCPGGGEPHPVELELVEGLKNFGSSSASIQRCRRCATLYRHHWFDVNDWGPNGDYWSETHVWTPLEADEVEALRTRPSYQPRAEPTHRWDSRWHAS